MPHFAVLTETADWYIAGNRREPEVRSVDVSYAAGRGAR
jgi:hypothetical protein